MKSDIIRYAMIIRVASQKKDLAACQTICLETSNSDFSKTRVRDTLLALYCDYYLEYHSDTCFVLANENDEAVGYILCAKDFDEYIRGYKEHYLRKLFKISLKAWLFKLLEFKSLKKYAKLYPAHLHIDILPEYQRLGFGHKLVDALIETLRKKNVPGVFLGVSDKNQKGISFYKKYGFKKVSSLPGCIIYAFDIAAD